MEFRFPDDVTGWLSEEEGRALFDLAQGKRVLEIGSYCGRSTICMAQSAERVTAVDPFDGRATTDPRGTFTEFLINIRRYGVHRQIQPLQGAIQDIAPNLEEGFDLVFIDGAHDEASVRRDLQIAHRLLKAGGLVVCHDYGRGTDPGVDAAVSSWVGQGARPIARHGSLVVLQPPSSTRSAVFLGLPMYGPQMAPGTARAAFATASRNHQVLVSDSASSALCMTFNNLWAQALMMRKSHKIRYFAMLHSDIEPQQFWLDVLIEELEKHSADMVSAVSPIKDDRGLTSTGIDDPEDPWSPLFRLTTRQAQALPETFGAADVGYPGHGLLLNTGCFVCRFDQPWVEEFHFETRDTIERDGEVFRVRFQPEDWMMSRALHARGLKLLATRKVSLKHIGHYRYPSDEPWGWSYDQDCLEPRPVEETVGV